MLLGMIVDTNAQWLTQELASIGIDVFWISQVGDNLGRVVDIIQRGLSRSDVIIMTGGLGPTEDDLTRESIAAALGETMVVDPELERHLRENFARRNRAMPERNVKQATLISSARAIPNPIGTAPGWWVEHDGTIIVTMPGVPSEMKLMWNEQVAEKLRARAGTSILVTRSLKALGLGESAVEEQLGELIHGTNPTVATYAKPDGVQVRISAKAATAEEARALIAPVAEQAEAALAPYVYARDDETLASVAAQILAAQGWTIASAERGLAGAMAAEICAAPSLLTLYQGGFIVNDDGTPLGIGRLEPADMASAARIQTGADVGVGAALNTDGERPFAEIAVDVRNHVLTDTTRWNMAIPELRRRAATETLALLLRALRETA
jgi:nicotinamide-nucleotide amidase